MSYRSNATWERRRFARTLAWLAVSLVAWPAATAEAQTSITWSGASNTSWSTGGNWFGSTAPSGTSNIAVFDSTGIYASGTQATLSTTNLSLNGIVVGNISSNLLISATGLNNTTLTINGSGIDMSNAGADVTLAPGNTFSMFSGTINVASGRMLTIMRAPGAFAGYSSGFTTGTTTITGLGTVRFLQAISVSSGGNLNIEGGTVSGVNGNSNQNGVNISNGILRLSNATLTTQQGSLGLSSGTFLQSSGTTSLGQLTNSVWTGTSAFTVNGGVFSAPNWIGTPGVASGAGDLVTVTFGGGTTTLYAFPTGRGAGATLNVNFNGGVFRPGASSSNFFGTASNAANLYAGTNGALIDTNGFNLTFAQPIMNGTAAGTVGSLTKLGAGTFTLSGSNTYTGTNTISAGVLNLGVAETAGVSGPLGNSAAVNPGNIVLTGGTLQYSAANQFDYSGRFSTAANQAYNVDTNSQTVIWAGNLSSSGGTLTKSGAGVLTLSGSNSYSGPTTLSAGQLNLNNANAIGTGTFTISGGTLDNTSGGAITLAQNNAQNWNGDFTFAGSNALNLGTGAVTLGATRQVTVTSSTLTGGGAIAGAFGLTKAGAGALTLSGSNSYSGPTTLSAGQLNLNNANAIGTGTFTISGGTLDNTSGGAITLAQNNAQNWNGDFTFAGSNNLDLGTGAVTLSANRTVTTTSGTLTVGGAVGGAFAFTKAGAGTLVLNGLNTFTGTTTVRNGTLVLQGGQSGTMNNFYVADTSGTNATLNVTSGSYGFGGRSLYVASAATSGTVNQAGGLVTFGTSSPGYQLLVGQGVGGNGVYNLSSGTLTTTVSSTFGIMLGVNNNSSGTFNMSGGTINMTTGGDSALQIGRFDLSGAANSSGAFNQTGGVANVGILSIGGSGTNGSGGTQTLTLTGGTFSANQFARLSSGSNNVATITIGGSADVTLPAFPTARGTSATATLFFDGGTLRPLAASATYMGGLTNAFVRSGGGRFDVPTGRDITVTQNLLTDGTSLGGGLTKSGSGTLTLSGSNSFSGNTRINAGSLTLGNANALAASTLDMNSGDGGSLVFGITGTNTYNIGGLIGSRNIATSGSVAMSVGANATSGTYSGVLSGGGAFTKVGAGTLTFSNANTYTGTTTVNAGTLQIGDAGATGSLSTSSVITGSAGTTLAFNRTNLVSQGTDFRHGIGGGIGLTQLGSGTLVLGGTNTYTGTTSLAAGTLLVNSGSALAGGGNITFVGGTLMYSTANQADYAARVVSSTSAISVDTNSQNVTWAAALASTNTGGLRKLGSGTLTLSSVNNYSGQTRVSQGVLALGIADAISNQSDLLVDGGGFGLAGVNESLATVTLTSGSIFGTGTLNATSFALGGGTVSANLGSGTVTVTAAATLVGTSDATSLNLNSGTLTLGSGSRFTSATIAVTGSSGGGLALGGNESFGSLEGAANIALGANTLSVGGANTSTTYSGIISGSGGLTKTGNGGLTLSAANTYTGATNISSGTIIASVANAISGSSAITIGSAGGRGFLKIDDALTISSLTFTGSGGDVIDPSNGLATFAAPSGTATINVVSGSNKFHANATLASPTLVNVSNGAYFSFHNNLAGGSSLTKSGSGTMNLTGDSDTLSGNLFITGGLVTIGPGMNQIGTGTTTLSNGSTIDLNGRSFTDRIVVLNGTILNAGGTATTTTIAGISTIGGTTAQGTYNITSTGSALFNVAIGDGAAAVDVNVNSGGGQASFAQAVGANGNVTVYGGGTATFDGTVAGYVIAHGASTFNGNVLSGAEVQVNSGTAGTGSALFAAGVASTVTVQSGAAAEFRGAVSGPTTVSGSALFTSASSLTGSLTTNAGGVATFDNVSADITGSIQANGLVTVNRASGSQTISGVISGTGSFTKQAAGTLVLTNANTFTGITTIAGGTLSVGNGGTSGALAGNVVNNAALIFNRSDNTTFAGNISGSGGLTKLGAGQLTLTGSSSYLGTTTVSSGTLAINGQIAGSAAVTGGATIGGSGVIGGVLSGAGLVSPGNSPGILTASQFDPSGGLDASFELTGLSPVYNAPTASVNDILRLTSGTPFTTALGGGNAIDFYFNMNSVGEGTYEAGFFTTLSAADLLSALQSATVNYWIKDSSGGQVFNGVKYSPYSGMTLSTATVTRNFGDGNVTGSVTQFIIVPEPEAIVLAGIGAAVAAWASRRRRR